MSFPYYVAVIDPDTGERVISTFSDWAKAEDLRATFARSYLVVVERVA